MRCLRHRSAAPHPLVPSLRRSPLEPPLDTALARRLIWNVLPAALVIGAVYMTVAGKSGLLARHALKQRVHTTQVAVEALHGSNAHKRARIAAIKLDPEALQRAAADELLVAPPGAVVYRFSDEPVDGRR